MGSNSEIQWGLLPWLLSSHLLSAQSQTTSRPKEPHSTDHSDRIWSHLCPKVFTSASAGPSPLPHPIITRAWTFWASGAGLCLSPCYLSPCSFIVLPHHHWGFSFCRCAPQLSLPAWVFFNVTSRRLSKSGMKDILDKTEPAIEDAPGDILMDLLFC